MLGKLVIAGILGLATLLMLPVLVLTAIAGQVQPEPSAAAREDIPPAFLILYQQAVSQRCPTLPWSVLAAIGKVESDHGRIAGGQLQPDGSVSPRIIGVALDGSPGVAYIRDTDGGRYDGDVVYDRAVGPMQFIPSTWTAYGIDASGDGIADPHNAIDAIHTAGLYLCASGADRPEGLMSAILAYNRSTAYRDRVLEIAAGYAGDVGIVVASPTLVAMVLTNPRLEIYPAGREDIASGRIDGRVLTVLQLLSREHTLTIVSLKTGHSRCVGGGDYPGCRESHHWHGRAVDIAAVDGRRVSQENHAARSVAEGLHRLPEALRPSEVGSPWLDLRVLTGFFSDAAHAQHIHLGWRFNAR